VLAAAISLPGSGVSATVLDTRGKGTVTVSWINSDMRVSSSGIPLTGPYAMVLVFWERKATESSRAERIRAAVPIFNFPLVTDPIDAPTDFTLTQAVREAAVDSDVIADASDGIARVYRFAMRITRQGVWATSSRAGDSTMRKCGVWTLPCAVLNDRC